MKQFENKHRLNDIVSVTLGAYIRQAREKHNISARRLSADLHMHPSYISRVEAGNFKQPSPEKLQRIAERLGLDYSNLCALAGYQVPGLPGLPAYLRLKYDMSDEDARRISEYFELLRRQHGIVEKHAPSEHDTSDDTRQHVSWTQL